MHIESSINIIKETAFLNNKLPSPINEHLSIKLKIFQNYILEKSSIFGKYA
jgi:hypothetical protein